MVGGAETGSRVVRTQPGGRLWSGAGKAAAGRQGSSWWTRWQTAQPRAPARGNKASNLWLKTPVGVEVAAGETPSLTGECVGETHGGLESAQAHPLRKQHQSGPIWLWVGEGVTENQQSGAKAMAPYPALPHVQCHSAVTWSPCPGEHLRLHPFT